MELEEVRMARSFRGRTPRVPKEWSSIASASLSLTANGTFLGASTTFGFPSTVLRVISGITIGPTSAPAALDEAHVTVGLGVFSADAFAAGATPDPETEPQYPWLFWKHYSLFFPTTSADPSVLTGSVREMFDIRSMRKLKPREDVGWVVQYSDIAGTPPLHVNIEQSRMLITHG